MKTKPLITLVMVLLLLQACAPDSKAPPDQVTVQLKWVHQAQFAGFYMAQEKGYYAEENLDVILKEGGPDLDIIDQVLTGAADFGVFAPENLIVARGEGQPVVAIGVILRQSPLVFVSLAESGITRPQDFIGKRAGLAPEAIIQLRAMMQHLGLDADLVELESYTYDHALLYDGVVDITYGYSTGGLIRMQETGRDFNVIWPGDYGIHFYSDTIFTTD